MAGSSARTCPACPDGRMEAFVLQPTPSPPPGFAVHGCRRCGGVWVDRETLDAILASAARLHSDDGRAPQVARRQLRMTDAVVYRPCSVCAVTMNRRNFAQISGVIVDECREHGTFFDAGELEHVVAFVRSGGMLLARERKQEELERQRRRDELGTISQTRSPLMGDADAMPGADWLEPDLGLAFVRWAGRWVRNMFR